MDFFTGGSVIDYRQKLNLKLKHLNDGFVSYKRSFLSSQDVN